MFLTFEGVVLVAGSNLKGRLGVGAAEACAVFTPVELPPCRFISLGSLYSLVIAMDGQVFAFGTGGYGNLGIGRRVVSQRAPTPAIFPEETPAIVMVSALIEQPNVKDFPLAQIAGQEGPTSFAIDVNGAIYGWGTAHKRKLGNCSGKVLCPDKCDELVPIKLGGKSRDTHAVTQYLAGEKIIQVIGCHIHSAALAASGRLFTFGCGSDGRLGQDGFIDRGRKRRLKFYQSVPTAIETLVRENVSVSFIASGRNHMAAIGNK
jgi:alpha-tubulin suppressor-like RCC1 family protein